MVSLIERMFEALERAEGALWGHEVGDDTTLQRIATSFIVSVGSSGCRDYCRGYHPGWSAHAIVTIELESRPSRSFYGEVESVVSFPAAESRHQRKLVS